MAFGLETRCGGVEEGGLCGSLFDKSNKRKKDSYLIGIQTFYHHENPPIFFTEIDSERYLKQDLNILDSTSRTKDEDMILNI